MEEFFMSKNTNLDEEIIFFDAEIVEDDGDEDIPVGTLISAPQEENENLGDVASDEMPEEIQEENEDTTDEVVDEIPAEDVAVEDTPVVEEESAPAVENESMAEETPVVEEKKPAPKKAPAKPKTTSTAPKKQINEADIWGVAVINTKKKPAKPVEEVKEEEPKPAPKKAPAKKATPAPKQEAEKEVKKPAPKKAETVKEENAPAPKKAEPKTNKNTKNTSEEAPKVAKETKAPEETIIQEGTREYHGKFIIKKTDKGHFVYKLFAYGNKCVAIGAQAYEGLSGVKGGIASVAKIAGTAPIENQTLKSYETLKFPKWEIYADKKGEFRLRLYASNGNLVATTNDGYLSVQAAKKGIESVAKAADGAAIVRNDNAW